MDATEFRKFGRAAVDYIADYLENIRDRPVLPTVAPGYLQQLIPDNAPQSPESWEEIMADLDRVVMPGITHWQSPQFHAYYPTAGSYPSVVGEMLSSGISCIGFSWIASPACTELEAAMLDWLGKMMALPAEFLNCSQGNGGGVIQGSASEATLVGLLAAKERCVRRECELHPDLDEGDVKKRLVAYSSATKERGVRSVCQLHSDLDEDESKTRLAAYSSDQSNSSVEKAGLLGSMPMRLLPSDNKCRLRGATLEEAIRRDKEKGLIPCYVVATLGTTGTCAFDCLDELGLVCQKEGVWLHVDAAYAGAAFICPEFRHLMSGVERADSFNFNPHKWMLVNFDCSAMWVKDSRFLVDAFNVDRIYLKHHMQGHAPDYRHWQIPLGRRFRALKLWFVLRCYGVQGLQAHIRRHVALAREFEALVRADSRFEIATDVSLGLVCFRLKGPDHRTRRLLDQLTARRRIYVIAANVREALVIRFVVCSRLTETRDIVFAWEEIRAQVDAAFADVDEDSKLLNRYSAQLNDGAKVHSPQHNGISDSTQSQDCSSVNGFTNGHSGLLISDEM